ncbi:Rieske (2Fe-2S) protein [Pseudomonas alkylphenolica]|uniref:Rieske (2Fe-2S) protein n=1 Tax=Pseudomonas alkylphenolica TaxID=237609 RepID=UPI0018D854CF|nr:Rieske 2Fe-2S domain-containing protein [Pseudomonas alkylphenolica]MBH3428852.1 Rieske 2Fe-2S domain-containing protein [Pseudomonas alkylphenolica]
MSLRYPVPAHKVPERGGRALLAFEGKSLALFNVADSFYAIDDSCPHQGASLCGGRLEGRVIQCCAHGLRFDLASGYLLNSTALKVNSYPVEQQGDQLYIVYEEAGQ